MVYDDEMVEKILDRSQVSENPEGEETEVNSGMNEYLRSFKVATYSLKEDESEEVSLALKLAMSPYLTGWSSHRSRKRKRMKRNPQQQMKRKLRWKLIKQQLQPKCAR